MSIDALKIVKALRDVVAKAQQTKTVVDQPPQSTWPSREVSPTPYEVEAYSREHIVGRIAGLADAIEAMDGQP